MGPKDLGQVIGALPPTVDPNLLVGTDTVDDAAVYRLTDDLVLVQTVDFFTPVVDDPYDFGRIAAVNSLSDVYAMGGTPRLALNIVGFPVNTLPLEYLVQILKGGFDVAAEAGVTIAGGHTIDDNEPKYGMAVTGTVHPEQFVANATARAGDVVVLTKPIGTGIIATAIKRGLAADEVVRAATEVMTTLNRDAAEIALKHEVTAMTDVTGFGLLGHLGEMAQGSGLTAEVFAGEVPFLPGAVALAEEGVVPGGTKRNLEYLAGDVEWPGRLEPWERWLLTDAQTSGGLLIAVAENRASDLVAGLQERGVPAAAVIGRFADRGARVMRISGRPGR
ncbi:MAG: selenide, water dikinase SelD [Thermoleophilia bacterium]